MMLEIFYAFLDSPGAGIACQTIITRTYSYHVKLRTLQH